MSLTERPTTSPSLAQAYRLHRCADELTYWFFRESGLVRAEARIVLNVASDVVDAIEADPEKFCRQLLTSLRSQRRRFAQETGHCPHCSGELVGEDCLRCVRVVG